MQSMEKTIFDYETDESSTEDSVKIVKLGKKRTVTERDNNYLRLMVNEKQIIKDIEMNCKNKRLKKNLFKTDCQRLGLHEQASVNPSSFKEMVIDN